MQHQQHFRFPASSSAALAFGLAAALAACTRPTSAQNTEHHAAQQPPVGAAHAHSDRAHAGPSSPGVTITAAARAQLAAARRATAAFRTPQAARASGFQPMFGHVPLQGEHYVRVDRVLDDSFDVERPSILIFAPVRGTPTLVGVAYAFLHPAHAAPPAGFDGAGDDVWHAHEGLSQVPGKHILMMHAWFVEAPDGPFARQNPWLPFLAAGLTPPSASALADSASGARARRLGFALAAANTPPLIFQWLSRQGGEAFRSRAEPEAAAIRALIPRLAAAQRAGATDAVERLVTEAIGHGDALADSYRDAMPARPIARRLVDRTVDEFLGRGHGIEEELSALLQGGGSGANVGELMP